MGSIPTLYHLKLSILHDRYCGPRTKNDYLYVYAGEELARTLRSIGFEAYQAKFHVNLPHIHPVGPSRYNDFCIKKDLMPLIQLYDEYGTDYAGLSLAEFLNKVSKHE